MSTYLVAERFKSIQGEGAHTGTPMAFIRFIGCSVGKKVCAACDTDFDKSYSWRGGGMYTEHELVDWAFPYKHICLTGGEPLDQDLKPIFGEAAVRSQQSDTQFHVETSGTVLSDTLTIRRHGSLWICVSPKPGYLSSAIDRADEIKVIVPGLGPGDGWPTLDDALGWARNGKLVYLQPRNRRLEIDRDSLMYVQDIVREHPELRLSVQMHKILKV